MWIFLFAQGVIGLLTTVALTDIVHYVVFDQSHFAVDIYTPLLKFVTFVSVPHLLRLMRTNFLIMIRVFEPSSFYLSNNHIYLIHTYAQCVPTYISYIVHNVFCSFRTGAVFRPYLRQHQIRYKVFGRSIPIFVLAGCLWSTSIPHRIAKGESNADYIVT